MTFETILYFRRNGRKAEVLKGIDSDGEYITTVFTDEESGEGGGFSMYRGNENEEKCLREALMYVGCLQGANA